MAIAAAAPAPALLPLDAADDCAEERRLCAEGGDGDGSTLRMLAASYTTGANGEERPTEGEYTSPPITLSGEVPRSPASSALTCMRLECCGAASPAVLQLSKLLRSRGALP